MKSLISVNYKFMEISPKKLVETILKSKHTKGIELCINYENEEHVKYLNDLVFEIKKNNLILQIHGDSSLDFDKQLLYMNLLKQISDELGYPIIFTIHTVYDEDKEISLTKSLNYISDLINNIDNDKIVVALENLNDSRDFIRLGKDEIREPILNDERLYFAYDIGHELADYGNVTDLDEYMIEDIRNIHLHTNDNKGNDHLPIYKNDIHYQEIMKSLIFLINNKYKYNIVYEYALECCHGETKEEKLIDYLNSIDLVSEKYER